MPSYFLTVRFALSALGPEDEVSSADMPDSASEAYEKQGHVFYETDSESVAAALVELFRRTEPPRGPGRQPLAESRPVVEVVNTAGMDMADRVLLREDLALLQRIVTIGGDDSGVWANAGFPDDEQTMVLVLYNERARKWEPDVRDELDVAHGKAKGFYLWWTWWAVCPQEPTANLKERTYFYRVDTEDVAARLREAFGKDFGIDIRFGYTSSEALDIDEIVRANNSIEKYRRGEYTGEDAHLFEDARQWEYGLLAGPRKPLPQKAADDDATQRQPCTVICLNERLARVLRQAGLNTVSTLDRPVYEYAPAVYVHSPDVVLGLPDAIHWPVDSECTGRWRPEYFAEDQQILNSALVAASHPPLVQETPPQYENLLKGLRAGALIAVVFVEPAKVDIRYRKYCLREGASGGAAFTAEDATRLFGGLPPILEYAAETLWGLVPVDIRIAEDSLGGPCYMAAYGLRYEVQDPPNSRFAVPAGAPRWATQLLPLFGPTIRAKLDRTHFRDDDCLMPLYQNMAGDLLGCAYRTEKGAILVLPQCRDEAAKTKVLRMLATDLWEPIQEWLRTENDFGGCSGGRPCIFSVRPCDEARPELKHLLQAVKLHRLLFLWYAHAQRWNWSGHWETLDRHEAFDPDDLKQHRGDQPLPAEVLLRHAKGVEDFVNAAYDKFGAGEGAANVYDEGLYVFWPEWQIWIDGVDPLEASADEICRLAIAVLGQHTPDWASIGIVEKCRGVARWGFPKWSPHRELPWRYLEELDSTIVSLNHAIWSEETKSGNGGPHVGNPDTPSKPALVADDGVAVRQAKRSGNGPEVLDALLEDANYCLMVLGDMRRDYGIMEAASRRMEGGGEDWHFADHRDESDHGEARGRIESNMRALPERLTGVLNWGLQHGIETTDSQDMLTNDKMTYGLKADACGDCERDVRAVMNAILVEQTRERIAGARTGTGPTTPKARTTHVDVPAAQCYGELGIDGKEQFVLRILLRRGDQPGKRPEVCRPILLQKQAYRILAEGIENARKRWTKTEQMKARDAGEPERALECEPPPGHHFAVEWSRDDLALILCKRERFDELEKAQKEAIKSAVRRLSSRVTFDKNSGRGLVSEMDSTGTRRATILLRLQKAGQP